MKKPKVINQLLNMTADISQEYPKRNLSFPDYCLAIFGGCVVDDDKENENGLIADELLDMCFVFKRLRIHHMRGNTDDLREYFQENLSEYVPFSTDRQFRCLMRTSSDDTVVHNYVCYVGEARAVLIQDPKGNRGRKIKFLEKAFHPLVFVVPTDEPHLHTSTEIIQCASLYADTNLVKVIVEDLTRELSMIKEAEESDVVQIAEYQ